MSTLKLALLGSVSIVVGCASAPASQAYVAPTTETITSETEQSSATPPTHSIYITNRSTVPVTVFSISLAGCENLRETCGVRPMNLHVAPGQRALAIHIEPANERQSFSYRFHYSWHPDSSMGAVNALADAGDARARQIVDARRRADSLRRTEVGPHYNDLLPEDLQMLSGQIAALRSIPDSVVLAPGEGTSIEAIRIVAVDKQGNVLGRVRMVSYQVPVLGSPLTFTPPGGLLADHPGRTALKFRLSDQASQIVGPLPGIEVPIVVR